VLFFLVTTSILRIFEAKGMMGLVICVANGMDYKLFFLKIVHMHITCIVWLTDYN
jgi:hypothetical protein